MTIYIPIPFITFIFGIVVGFFLFAGLPFPWRHQAGGPAPTQE